MHYIHRLTPGQKNAAIGVFIGVPATLLLVLFIMWGWNRGLFKKTATLKTTVASIQGIDTDTPVTLLGVKIGRVAGFRLGQHDRVELELMIERQYLDRIHTDAVAVTAAASVLGIKEIKIRGGSETAPLMKDGDSIVSEELFDMDNLMDRVSPILVAAEKIVFRIEKILNGFPDERLNAAVDDMAGVIKNIRDGKSTVGKLVSSDNGAFYQRIDRLADRLATLSERMTEASARLPETMDNVAGITGNLKTASAQWPEMHRNMNEVLKNMDHLLADMREMAPTMKKTVANVGAMAEDLSHTTARVPLLLDDMESTLNDTLAIVKGLKQSWPVKNMVPPEKEKPLFEPAARESVYGGGR